MDFLSISHETAKSYLTTVLTVDDMLGFGPLKDLTDDDLLPEDNDEFDDDFSGLAPMEYDSKDIKVADHYLDYQELSKSFAVHGLHCSGLKPDTNRKVEDVANEVCQSASQADLCIFDWEMEKGKDGSTAKAIISKLVKDDYSSGGRLRLVIIYTGLPEEKHNIDIVRPVADLIQGNLPQTSQHEVYTENNRVDICDQENNCCWRVVCIGKNNVEPNELPEEVIKIFTELTSGLLSNATLASVSELRKITNNLLYKFNRKLDFAFASHFLGLMSLPDSRPKADEAAFDYAVGLITDEIKSRLQTSSKVKDALSKEVLCSWPNEVCQSEHNVELSILIGDNGPYQVKDEQLSQLLKSQSSEELKRVLFDIGVNDSKENAIRELSDKLSRLVSFEPNAIQELLSESSAFDSQYNLLDEFEKKPILIKSSEDDNSHESLCIVEATRRSCLDISRLSTISLKQGTVLRAINTQSKEYYICIQPLCDSVRLRSKTSFVFIKSQYSYDKFNLVLEGKDENHKINVSTKSKNLTNLNFDVEKSSGMVFGKKSNGKIIFNTKCHHMGRKSKPVQLELEWVGELKEGLSQSFANQVSATLSRVGLDVNEWARLK